MRRHGKSAARHELSLAREIDLFVAEAMWCARVHREARAGAIVVAGKHGEVLRVDSVGLDGYGVDTTVAPYHVRPDVIKRVGSNWVQEDLRITNLGDDPCSVHGHVARDRRASAAPSPRPGQVSTRKPKGTRTQGA